MTAQPPSSVVIDWGTSSFRLWLLGADGEPLAERTSDQGADRLDPPGFERVLRSEIAQLTDAGLLPRGPGPVVICGMAGARNGWREAPYVRLPAAPAAIVAGAVPVPAEGLDVRILPGLATAEGTPPDVIRGEETQLLGLAETAAGFAGRVCMPGTHCKWVRLAGGVVEAFSTAMTGELYALLAQRSVLRHVIGEAQADPESDAFAAGVHDAMAAPERFGFALFAVRAAGLLEGKVGEEAASRLSGLLIGAELAAARLARGDRVALVAAGRLAALYLRGLALAGAEVEIHDAGVLVRRGLRHAALRLQEDRT